MQCSSTNCLVECGRVLNECNSGCPCELGCPNGCAGCANPICVCGDQSTPQNDENLKTCIGQNSIELGQCILDCDENETCEADCIKEFKNHHKNCPCQVIGPTMTGTDRTVPRAPGNTTTTPSTIH